MERNEVDENAMGGTELMGQKLERYCDKELLSGFQIIRSRVRQVDPNRKAILWLHDLPLDPESAHLKNPDSRARFTKIVMVSDWQMQMYHVYLGVPYGECIVMKNAIDPIPLEWIKKSSATIRLIYHPTPQRGLEILVPVFEKLCEWHEDIELDVFSSFALYGWKESDAAFASVIERCKNHPKINYYGSQPNEVVRKAVAESHIFAYPSIWQETSCLCAMEAMSAGSLVVAPNYGALPETTAGFAAMYQWNEDIDAHAEIFLHELDNAIRAWKGRDMRLREHLDAQKAYADRMYAWQRRAVEWNELLRSL
jgi:glycosyltransferase involved in cell wall biosynthesis